MVLLTITPAARRAIEAYQKLRDEPAGQALDEPPLIDPEVGDPVSHAQLIEVARFLKRRHGEGDPLNSEADDKIDLESLLKGSKIYVPPAKAKQAQTSEYVALMAHLREEEERRSYQRMIDPPVQETFAKRYPSAKTFGSSLPMATAQRLEDDEVSYADINRQMTLIINVLISIICCSVAIWIAARRWDTPQRLALSMTGSVVVAVAEVAIYMGYIRRIKVAKSDEARIKEHKEVVDTWIIDGKDRKALASANDSLRHRKGKHR